MGKQSKNAKNNNTSSGAPKAKAPAPPVKKKTGPPFEISAQEYKDLLDQVKDLAKDEIQEEWILAARYGDIDVLHAILESSPHVDASVINGQDAQNGNTALHMAAANGHMAVVATLLQQRPVLQHNLTNHAGNTPLHWAAANGHDQVVQLLVKLPDVDVLQKNDFGRSVLTEGFTSEKTEVIKHLLEHDSATEERLVEGGKEVDAEEGDTNAKPKETVVHDLNFAPPDDNKNKEAPPLRIRELPIPNTQDPFGDRPELDTTGYGIWAASLVMARWMAASAERFNGQRLVELGAGCGVPGLAAAYYR